MYKRILAPLDGSQLSECTLEHVKAIATGCQVPEVILLWIIEPPTQIAEAPEEFIRDAGKRALDYAKDYLSKVADSLKKENIATRTVVLGGRPADEILDYAKKNNVDLVIMSTHGRSGVSRWAFGSVTDRVVRHSIAPVLVASPEGCRVSY